MNIIKYTYRSLDSVAFYTSRHLVSYWQHKLDLYIWKLQRTKQHKIESIIRKIMQDVIHKHELHNPSACVAEHTFYSELFMHKRTFQLSNKIMK